MGSGMVGLGVSKGSDLLWDGKADGGDCVSRDGFTEFVRALGEPSQRPEVTQNQPVGDKMAVPGRLALLVKKVDLSSQESQPLRTRGTMTRVRFGKMDSKAAVQPNGLQLRSQYQTKWLLFAIRFWTFLN